VEPPPPLDTPIIDTHQHLWDLSRLRLPWVAGSPKLDRSFLLADYLEAAAGLGVVKSVYMEVDVDPAQQAEEAEYALELCRRDDNPMVAAVIAGRPASPDFEAWVERFRSAPEIRGIRQVLHGAAPCGYCLAPGFVRGIRFLGQAGWSFDLCLRPAELEDGIRLVDLCPGTRFIVDHCGNAPVQRPDRRQWERDLAALAARPNTICKVSGIIAGARPDDWSAADLEPIVLHVLESFGPERVMFGGDWPVCTLAATLRQWVEALHWIVRDRPAGERRKLFHDNAARFYALE